MRTKLFAGVAFAALMIPASALAQSTGSIDFDEGSEIVVTGVRTVGVAGIESPDSSKAKAVLTQEYIARQNPGQTILDTINTVPGVSFQNNDAYGSSGGTLTIRGFTSDRISLTFDGVPLNDTGNYAIYSNQQIDPELIEQVNVNLGSGDVDSPTASAVGGTVNYRTKTPDKQFGAMLSGSAGEFDFMRIFGKVETGEFTPWGTRAFFSGSTASNRNPFNNYGKVNKQQYNGKIYQPIGSNGDFIALSGHYNENRNNFFGSLPLRNDITQSVTNSAIRSVGSGSGNRFPANSDEREYTINYPCAIAAARPGVADTANTCGTEFDRRYNPSNTGNIRINSRFTLADGLVLTVDPSFQYVKANGGGTATAREAGRDVNPTGGAANCTTVLSGAGVNCQPGYWGGSPYFGRDLNGDGDILDQVTVLAPSQTRTRRWGVIAGLRWDIAEDHTVRVSFTHDYGNHRQTGEVGAVLINGEPYDVFPVNGPMLGANGVAPQKRDRQSFAILDKVSGEYRGEFGDLTVNVGIAAPFYKRDLNQYCFTSSASGFVECPGRGSALIPTIAALNPTWALPQRRVYSYSKVLPNAGVVYHFTPQVSAFASFAQGLSVPGTDPLYNSIYLAAGAPGTKPQPETTDSFDGGLRFRSSKIQAQVSGWYTQYHNRLASAYDPEANETVYRNLGEVKKYGIDGSISFQPIDQLALYAFGSWNKSEIRDNVQTGATTFAPTAGKRESGSPSYNYGVMARGNFDVFELGITAKRTGSRFVYDTNLPVCSAAPAVATPTVCTSATNRVVYPAKTPAYWLVNLDARVGLEWAGLNDKTYLQLNVYNLFDQFYVGGFSGGLTQSSTPPFVQIGAPRTISGTLVVAF
ncbi:MAG: TonB-dependent receptor [Sphingomonadales bacterium]|nr:MAG: TonB-dependent receptor [Sphingomonadales bacterium]